VLEGFCQAFLSGYESWRDEGFAGVRQRWLGRAAGIGQTIEVRLEGETLSGIFAGLDGAGALILQRAGKEDRRISAGDVFFPAAADR
jgi:BirA family biotin operon repressor/biotin-[acetyl-CoA-carboxylase] ligase